MKKLFVLNCGSSSIKYKLFAIDEDFYTLAQGVIEHIGTVVKDYHAGFELIEKQLQKEGVLKGFDELDAAAHRVVHGGEKLVEPVLIDDKVIEIIRQLIPLAPLHNGANLEGILALRKKVPTLTQVAVFDTAFHQSMPALSYRYALPKIFYEKYGIRRFGFHGISHQYLLTQSAKILKKLPLECNLITIHLGNGSSITAIEKGKSIDTSMGFTPLEGLVMGTRSGDIDPGILFYLDQNKSSSCMQMQEILNHESGLKGLCGFSDMRDILEQKEMGNEEALFTFELFCRRIKKYIGAYMALLGRVDAIVFSGGIGANSHEVRASVCEGLASFGIVLDDIKNSEKVISATCVESSKSRVAVIVMQTDEELSIAQQSQKLLQR